MSEQSVFAEKGTWDAPGASIRIEYDPGVLEQIRASVQASFQKLPHGGLENGGILYGETEGATVRVLNWRPIDCEHALGPSFLLSESDRERLGQQLGSPSSGIEGLAPVGWFVSHSRGGSEPRDADAAVQSRFFPADGSILFLFDPAKDGCVEVSVFVHERGALARSSEKRFRLNPNFVPRRPSRRPAFSGAPEPKEEPQATREIFPEPQRVPDHNRAEAREPAEEAAPAVDDVLTEPEMVWFEEPESNDDSDLGPRLWLFDEPRRLRRQGWKSLLLWAAIVVAAGAAFLAVPRLTSGEPPSPPLILSVGELGGAGSGQLQIRWSLSPSMLEETDLAALDLVDGGFSRHIELETDEFRRGSLTYVRHSGELQVRLSVFRRGKPALHEYAQYMGPHAGEPSDPLKTPAFAAEKDAETARLRQIYERERDEALRLAESIRLIEERLRQEGGQ